MQMDSLGPNNSCEFGAKKYLLIFNLEEGTGGSPPQFFICFGFLDALLFSDNYNIFS